jgi:hypothetical protein
VKYARFLQCAEAIGMSLLAVVGILLAILTCAVLEATIPSYHYAREKVFRSREWIARVLGL